MMSPVQSPPTSGEEEGDAVALVEAMKRGWSPIFQISDSSDGINVVSAEGTRCHEAMAIRLGGGSFRGTPIEILFQLAIRLDPSLEGLPPPGVAASGPPGVRDELMKDVLMQPLSLHLAEGSLQEVLNRILSSSIGVLLSAAS